MVVFFIQTVPLVSTPYEDLRNAFSYFNFEFFGAHCSLKMDFYANFIFQILAPAILVGLLLVNLAGHYLVVTIMKAFGMPLAVKIPVKINNYVRTLCALLLFSYTTVSSTILSFLHCRDVGPYSVVASSPDVRCTTEEYSHYYILAIILLCLYVVLFPLALFVFLLASRYKEKLDEPTFSSYTGVLYQCYKSEQFFWEGIILVRRLVFVAVWVGFVSTEERNLALFSVAFAVLVIHVLVSPYLTLNENYVETSLLSILVVLAGIASSSASDRYAHNSAIYSTVVTSLAAIPILFAAYKVGRQFILRAAKHIKKFLSKSTGGAFGSPLDDNTSSTNLSFIGVRDDRSTLSDSSSTVSSTV